MTSFDRWLKKKFKGNKGLLTQAEKGTLKQLKALDRQFGNWNPEYIETLKTIQWKVETRKQKASLDIQNSPILRKKCPIPSNSCP